MNKKRLLKLADFIEKLEKKKLNMRTLVCPRTQFAQALREFQVGSSGSKMDRFHCNGAACAMGWTPAVFPRLVEWTPSDRPFMHIRGKGKNKGLWNCNLMAKIFDIPIEDAGYYIFSSGEPLYHTPKQVARGIREYVKPGKIPARMKGVRG